jgi:P4 family phage/plasmid primase-like protien
MARTKISTSERAQRLASGFRASQSADGVEWVFWRSTWHQWTGTHYRPVDDDTFDGKVCVYVTAQLDSALKDDAPSVGRSLVRDVITHIKAAVTKESAWEAPFALDSRGPSGQCVTFTNGILNITRLLAGEADAFSPEHDRHWFSLTCLPFAYQPEARAPKFDQFLTQTFESDQEIVNFLYEWFGYNCVVDYQFQHFVVLTGEGQVGKSTLLAVLEDLLGRSNISFVPYQLFTERFSLATTIGKLANIAGEIDGATRRAENNIKEYTGGGTMYVDIKGKAPVHLRPTARLTFACNKVPTFFDKSRAMRRRTIIVPFTRLVPDHERNTKLGEELRAELPGIFNRAVEGLKALYTRHGFHIPQRCEEAIEAHVLESNPALQFLGEFTELDERADVSADLLWDRYKFWYSNSGPFDDKLRNKAQFGRDVKTWSKGKVERVQLRKEGKRGYFYRGLRYTDDVLDVVDVKEAA